MIQARRGREWWRRGLTCSPLLSFTILAAYPTARQRDDKLRAGRDKDQLGPLPPRCLGLNYLGRRVLVPYLSKHIDHITMSVRRPAFVPPYRCFARILAVAPFLPCTAFGMLPLPSPPLPYLIVAVVAVVAPMARHRLPTVLAVRPA